MTWLHLAIPAQFAAAIWSFHRASVWLSITGQRIDTEISNAGVTLDRVDRLRRVVIANALINGWGYGLLALVFAVSGGFILGRVL